MSFALLSTPVAHALFFQIAAGAFSFATLRLLEATSVRRPIELDGEVHGYDGRPVKRFKYVSLSIITGFAISSYLKQDPYTIAIASLLGTIGFVSLQGGEMGVILGAVGLLSGTLLAGATKLLFEAISPISANELAVVSIGVAKTALYNPLGFAFSGALALSYARTLCDPDTKRKCDRLRTAGLGALAGFLAYKACIQTDPYSLIASALTTTFVCANKYLHEKDGLYKSRIQYPDIAVFSTIVSTLGITYGACLMQ